MAVDFTSLGRGLKFRLAFTGLSFCYPAHTHDETAVEVIPVIGELPAELVQVSHGLNLQSLRITPAAAVS